MSISATTLALILAMSAPGGLLGRIREARHFGGGGRILAPGPGYGWGFPNGSPDHYGWVDYGDRLPLGGDRNPEYFFPRYYASRPDQSFLSTYYNPYINRGERYIPYAGCGGEHPMGGPPLAPDSTPMNPYNETISRGARVPVPRFSGRVEAPPTNAGSSGLIP